MKLYIRCATVALLLIGSAGMAAAQKYPTGTPGTNDNKTIAPGTGASGSSIQSSAQNQTGRLSQQNQTGRSSERHARTLKQKDSAMSAHGSAAPTHRHVQKHTGGATQKQSGY